MSINQRIVILNVLAIILMKLVNQLTTFEYSMFNSNEYELINGHCQLQCPNSTISGNPIMNLKKTGYIFCALGGLLANKFLDFRAVLGLGGALMTLGVGLMGLSYWLRVICKQALYAFTWILHPVYMALVIPCLYFGFIRWARGPKSRTILVVLYYLVAGSTVWMNMKLMGIITAKKYHGSYTVLAFALIGLLLSMVFTSMCAALRPNHGVTFELPTKRRQFRYILIITTFTSYIMQLGDGHILRYQSEVLLFYNQSSPEMQLPPLLALKTDQFLFRLINQGGYYGTATALIFISSVHRIRFVSSELRFLIGVGMAAVVALVCLIANSIFASFTSPNPTLTVAIFSTAAFLDGVSEIMTMIAAYEFIDEITPRSHKLLTIGVMFSVWSLAPFFNFLIEIIIYDSILLNPTSLVRCRVNHAVDLVLLIGCFLYARFLSMPLSFTLMEEHQDDQYETIALLAVPNGIERPDFGSTDIKPV